MKSSLATSHVKMKLGSRLLNNNSAPITRVWCNEWLSSCVYYIITLEQDAGPWEQLCTLTQQTATSDDGGLNSLQNIGNETYCQKAGHPKTLHDENILNHNYSFGGFLSALWTAIKNHIQYTVKPQPIISEDIMEKKQYVNENDSCRKSNNVSQTPEKKMKVLHFALRNKKIINKVILKTACK